MTRSASVVVRSISASRRSSCPSPDCRDRAGRRLRSTPRHLLEAPVRRTPREAAGLRSDRRSRSPSPRPIMTSAARNSADVRLGGLRGSPAGASHAAAAVAPAAGIGGGGARVCPASVRRDRPAVLADSTCLVASAASRRTGASAASRRIVVGASRPALLLARVCCPARNRSRSSRIAGARVSLVRRGRIEQLGDDRRQAGGHAGKRRRRPRRESAARAAAYPAPGTAARRAPSRRARRRAPRDRRAHRLRRSRAARARDRRRCRSRCA